VNATGVTNGATQHTRTTHTRTYTLTHTLITTHTRTYTLTHTLITRRFPRILFRNLPRVHATGVTNGAMQHSHTHIQHTHTHTHTHTNTNTRALITPQFFTQILLRVLPLVHATQVANGATQHTHTHTHTHNTHTQTNTHTHHKAFLSHRTRGYTALTHTHTTNTHTSSSHRSFFASYSESFLSCIQLASRTGLASMIEASLESSLGVFSALVIIFAAFFLNAFVFRLAMPLIVMHLDLTEKFKIQVFATRITGWRSLIGSPELQNIVHKRATKYMSLLRKMTYKDKGLYESSPPCTRIVCNVMHCVECLAVYCSVLWCVAVRCSVLQCVFSGVL